MVNKKRNIVEMYDEIRVLNNLKPLPVAMYFEEHRESVILSGVSEYITRVWKDLDKMLELNKKRQITSRAAKINASSNKNVINPIKETLEGVEDQEFDFIDKMKIEIYYTIQNLLKGNERKVLRTLETLNSPNGRLMIAIVSAYCLGEALLKKFGSIEASKKLEITILARKKFEKELREAFKTMEFEEAVMVFKDKIKEYGESYINSKEMRVLFIEEYLYTIADKEDILKVLSDISESVRLEITKQPRLLIVEE